MKNLYKLSFLIRILAGNFCEASLMINEETCKKLKMEGMRNVLTTDEMNSQFINKDKSKIIENYNDLKFNIHLIKNSTDKIIQLIITQNKYLIDVEKNKIKESQDEEEEIL